jgi:hypothetical protein
MTLTENLNRFWIYGVTGSLSIGTGACRETYTFFFAKLRANGGIRVWYIILFSVCTAWFGIMTLVSIIGPVTRLVKMKWLAKYKFFRTSTRLKYATGFTYGQ